MMGGLEDTSKARRLISLPGWLPTVYHSLGYVVPLETYLAGICGKPDTSAIQLWVSRAKRRSFEQLQADFKVFSRGISRPTLACYQKRAPAWDRRGDVPHQG